MVKSYHVTFTVTTGGKGALVGLSVSRFLSLCLFSSPGPVSNVFIYTNLHRFECRQNKYNRKIRRKEGSSCSDLSRVKKLKDFEGY